MAGPVRLKKLSVKSPRGPQLAFVKLAMIRLMTRSIARPSQAT